MRCAVRQGGKNNAFLKAKQAPTPWKVAYRVALLLWKRQPIEMSEEQTGEPITIAGESVFQTSDM